MEETVLIAKNIQKRYENTLIINNLDMNIKKGEIYGLIGKNGSGKTTLIKIITGLITKHNGSVKYSDKLRISAILDFPSVFLNLTALENMILQNKLLNYYNRAELIKILEQVGLNNDNKTIKKYSLGMTQRLRIALSLLNKPDLLLLDEPLNGLDPEGVVDFRKMILDLNKEYNVTILVSSHILHELELISTRFGILHDGKIVKEFSQSELNKEKNNLENIYMSICKGENVI